MISKTLVHQKPVSDKELVTPIELDKSGNERPHIPPEIQLWALDVYRLIMPDTNVRMIEQVQAVIICLMSFMAGLKVELMPLGEIFGSSPSVKSTRPAVLSVTLLLGIGVTFTEPAIGALTVLVLVWE